MIAWGSTWMASPTTASSAGLAELAHQAVEQDGVHREGDGAAALHQQRGFGVVLRAEQVDAELRFLVEVAG